VFCNNAVWPHELNARIATHVSKGARRLAVFAVMKELTEDAAHAAGLVFVRRTALPVSWDRTGWPLYIYRPRASCPHGVDEVAVDDAFHAAQESSTGFSMC
jgi:hypothetical protein